MENYEEDNPKCIRLKTALHYPCVRMITTRDNLEALKQLAEGLSVPIARVSDPAVFSSVVFADYRSEPARPKKKIGLFVIRDGAFADNRVPFNHKQVVSLWQNLEKELNGRGYDVEFLTSGFHSDEAFLSRMMTEYGLKNTNCVITLNTPEKLVQHIASFDGVVSCRLHPSIISYSLRVPAVGLVWNNKVSSFYHSIGYPDRALMFDALNCKAIADRLEAAMEEGVQQDLQYLMSSYQYLFQEIRKILCPQNGAAVFSYEELVSHMPRYTGSNLQEKLDRKFSRLYRTFNRVLVDKRKNSITLKKARDDYNALQNDHNALRDDYNALRNDYNVLRDNYNALLKRCVEAEKN